MRTLLVLFCLLCLCWSARGQIAGTQKAEITGRVFIKGEPVAGVSVFLVSASGAAGPEGSAITNQEGRYKLASIAPGNYIVKPIAPAFVYMRGGMSNTAGRAVTVGEGELAEEIDFLLEKGGAITGRITDRAGRPIAEERISLFRLDENGQKITPLRSGLESPATDDRGIYRVFGLEAGRYIVMVGTMNDSVTYGQSRAFPLTYYPGVNDEKEAKIVELTQGQESTGIDIRVSNPLQTYRATGHVIDTDTDRPVFDASIGYARVDKEDSVVGRIYSVGWQAGVSGEFSVESLAPGRYALVVLQSEGGEFYSDPERFEVIDSDVRGLEVRLHRGGSISGTVVIEGSSDPQNLEERGRVQIAALPLQAQSPASRARFSAVGPDGSFRIRGLSPGRFAITLTGSQKGFVLSRVERDDGQQLPAIELRAGEQASSIRVIVSNATGSIRGQVNIVGRQLPAGTFVRVVATRQGSPLSRSASIDSRDGFLIQFLPDGEYAVWLYCSGAGVRIPPQKQKIIVSGGGEARAILTLDLSKNGGR